MIPNYSNWLAKRVWAVNQSRARGEAPSPSGSDYAAWARVERESQRSAERYLAKWRRYEEKLHRKWLKDHSRKQREIDYSYLDDVFSGAMGIRIRKAHPFETWNEHFVRVTERVREIGEKYNLDLEAYAVQHYPQHYHKERGDNSLRSRDYETAHEEYQKAIDSGGEETWVAYVNKSSTFLMQDSYDECEAACRKALELNPRSAGAYFNLGQVAAARGDGEAAERYLAKAMELDDKIRQRLLRMGLG